MGLEVEPDFGGPCEVAGEAHGGVGGERTPAFDDLIDAARGDADVFGQPVFRKAEWQEKVLAQDFAGVDGGVGFHGQEAGSMVVHDGHILRAVGRPAEADAPLVVDADGVLAFAPAFEGFQVVAGRQGELGKGRDGVKLRQLPQSGALNVGGDGAVAAFMEKLGGVRAVEGADHGARAFSNAGR